MRVFENGGAEGGFYFRNSQFKTLKPQLERVLKDSRRAGVELTAWMITRNYKWITDRSLLDVKYENGPQYIKKLDIFNPVATNKILKIYQELASTGVTSIMMQDDAVLKRTEGLSRYGKNQFQELTGSPPVEKFMLSRNHFYFENWLRIKINRINSLVENIVQGCKGISDSSVEVGMNIYYETPVFTSNSEKWYAHNLSELLFTGADKFYLMAYHRQIKREMKYREKENRVFFRNLVNKAYKVANDKLVVKMQIRDWQSGERIDPQELKGYLKLIPKDVKNICFTPIKKEDIEYLKDLIKYIRGREQL